MAKNDKKKRERVYIDVNERYFHNYYKIHDITHNYSQFYDLLHKKDHNKKIIQQEMRSTKVPTPNL